MRIPIWAIWCKLMVRLSGTRTRLYVEVPTGLRARAERLRECLGGVGRIEEGTLHVEGRALPGAMRALGYPAPIIDLAAEIIELRGTPGVKTPVSVLERRAQLVDCLKIAIRDAKTALR